MDSSVFGRSRVRRDETSMMRFLIAIFAGVLLLALANAAHAADPAKAPEQKPAATQPAPAKSTAPAKKKGPSFALPKEVKKLVINDITRGQGADEVANGKKLKVHYTGWLYDSSQPEGRGAQFDTTAGSAPFEFVLGTDRVIKGWEEGVLGMKAGGKRRLLIPAEMGYGAGGAGDKIPPNSPLLFEVELVSVEKI